MYKNLNDYIALLERKGELMRVRVEVDPLLEIAEITDRVSKSEGAGKALLFENTGTQFPVITNMMGSDSRICTALGVESLDELSLRIETLLKRLMSPKSSMMDKLRMLPTLAEMSHWLPRTAKGRGECQNTILIGEQARLSLLPVLKCWPCDGGRFITLPLVNTLDPDSGARNVGMYRMQIFSDYTAGMHWHIHKTGERHFRAYQRRGEKMPVSICLGGDPVYTYAATAPMPDNMDEYLLAGFLRRKSVTLVKSITNDIYVPSDCDFVIEGYVDPEQAKVVEGPFGDHTGFYSLEELYPMLHVTAITHRKDAVYPATIVGVPPQEDVYIAKATEKIFLAPIRFALQPEIEDLYMPEAGVAHNIALVEIKSSYAGQAFKVANAMWGAGQMMFNKFILVASDGADVRDYKKLGRLLRGVNIGEDLMFSRGTLDVLDHATATMGVGAKLMIDLTCERTVPNISLPKDFVLPDGVVSCDSTFAESFGAIVLRCDGEPEIEQFMTDNQLSGINCLLVMNINTSQLTQQELLWLAAANTDPARDMRIVRGVLVADARSKTDKKAGYPARWPNVVTSDSDTITLVDRRWAEYGFTSKLRSPSIKYSALIYSDKAQV